MIDKTLALVRPFGHHFLGIHVNEKFSPLRLIYYIASDVKYEDWSWLELNKIKIIKLDVRPAFFLDPIKLMRGSYGLGSLAYLSDLERSVAQASIIDSAEVYTFFTYQSIKIAKKLRKPIAVDVIESIPRHLTSKIPPYSYITKHTLRNADLLIALTKRAVKYLMSIGAREEKIKQIYPGIDLDTFKPRDSKRADGNVRILFVGALTKNKGILTLLEAFRGMIKKRAEPELWIAGDGPLRSMIELYAKRYPIKVLGYTPWRRLPNIYRNCDVFCLPSMDKYLMGTKVWEEQFGIVLVEAMASGLPIVATECGAIPEVIGSKNFIVKQGSIKLLRTALETLIEDEKLRMRIGFANRKRAEEFFDGRKQCLSYAREVVKLT